jgi:transcriptional adapter 2-alpha
LEPQLQSFCRKLGTAGIF